ncbi:MAG: DUF4255 domain-containing protein [Geodermatophilaceae bacterium]|nr:DUF4255 domain-containing protein [Geodermatophilaceae bacterium]
MIAEVTQALVDHLLAQTAELELTWIEAASLEAAAILTQDRLQVCLYAIDEQGLVRNASTTPTDQNAAPLALRLSYVLHYSSTDHLEVQRRLDRVIQVIRSTPVLSLDSLAGAVDRLEIRLHWPSAEELNSLWVAFGRGLRLAAYCQIDVALTPP